MNVDAANTKITLECQSILRSAWQRFTVGIAVGPTPFT